MLRPWFAQPSRHPAPKHWAIEVMLEGIGGIGTTSKNTWPLSLTKAPHATIGHPAIEESAQHRRPDSGRDQLFELAQIGNYPPRGAPK